MEFSWMNWKTSICFHFWSFISLFIYFTLILTHSPILTELSVVLLVSMTGSMRWYLKPIQVTDIVQLLQDSIFIHAVAKMFALHLSAQCITWMLNNNIQEYWPGSRVRSIATALQNDISQLLAGLLLHMLLMKLSNQTQWGCHEVLTFINGEISMGGGM